MQDATANMICLKHTRVMIPFSGWIHRLYVGAKSRTQ